MSDPYTMISSNTRAIWKSTAVGINNANVTNHQRFQPGGFVSIVHGSSVGRIKQTAKDQMGRWISNYLYRQKKPPLCIINAYMPCVQANPGISTYVHHLYQILTNVNSPLEVRTKCWDDLTNFILQQQELGMTIIVGMDANANPNKEEGIIQKLMQTCNLIDGTKYINPAQINLPTYTRGKWRLDIFLISNELRSSIMKCMILPQDFPNISDHRGLILDVETQNLFGNQTDNIVSPNARKLILRNPHRVEKYRLQIQKEFKIHKINKKSPKTRDKILPELYLSYG